MPNPVPLSVTVPPISAAGGVMLVMTGLIIVNVTFAGLGMEFTVTRMGPVPGGVALATVATICELFQLVTEAASAPLKLTVLVP